MRNWTARPKPSRFPLRKCGISLLVTFTALAVLAVPAAAEHTRFWRQSDYANFEKGTAHGVALRSDGKLVLAPRFALFADANLAYLWALQVDSRGNLYAAGGSNAKVVRFDPSGKQTVVFESQELTAQTLALDKNNNLYVGTSPDGKVYKITPEGTKSVFFDPKTKYIWDLAIGPGGMLYVATGDTGKIFQVTPDGHGKLFYASNETHIRSLAFDGKGDLLAGTEPNGLVLRIPLANPSPAVGGTQGGDASQKTPANNRGNTRRAYVLYETPKREITSLLTDAHGNIYVAAIGEKKLATSPAPGTPMPVQHTSTGMVTSSTTITVTASSTPTVHQTQPHPTPMTFVPFPRLATSAVYRIAPDGSPEEIWTSRRDVVYSLGLSADGKLLLGVGNQGAVIELGSNRVFTRLARTESAQVTRLVRAADGKTYVATANPGKVFTLGPNLESEGHFDSQPFDAEIFSRWGRLTWWGKNAVGTKSSVEMYVRSGNTSSPENNWSRWYGPYRNARGDEVKSPAARFVQWRAVLRRANGAAPELSWVSLAYLRKNVAPEINGIALQVPGVRVSGVGGESSAMEQMPVTLRMPPTNPYRSAGEAAQPSSSQESDHVEPTPQGYARKGYESVLWNASDANGDEIVYSVYYRAEGDTHWSLLKDKLHQEFYSWDTTSMPDGAYYLKVVASDAPSNPPNQALQNERESERFIVDNTPPQIAGLTANSSHAEGDPSVTARFEAQDKTSPVVRAQYSLDAGDWKLVLPVGELSDSLTEHYSITLRKVSPGEHTLAVRVFDQFDNVAAASVNFSVPASGGR